MGCSAKLSVIFSVTYCPTGSGRGCNVTSSGKVVIDSTRVSILGSAIDGA